MFKDTKRVVTNRQSKMTDNMLAKRKGTERKPMIDKTILIRLTLSSTNEANLEMNSVAPEWFVVPVPLVAPVMVIFIKLLKYHLLWKLCWT